MLLVCVPMIKNVVALCGNPEGLRSLAHQILQVYLCVRPKYEAQNLSHFYFVLSVSSKADD